MNDHDRNHNARFLPLRNTEEPDDLNLPCIEIAGVQVYVYFRNNELCISAHYDGADDDALDSDHTIPTRVTIGNTTIYPPKPEQTPEAPHSTDSEIIDCIATLLGTAEEWSSPADFLDDIATLTSQVRPHPGEGDASEYAERFERATGRPVNQVWNQNP